MRPNFHKRTLKMSDINARARSNPTKFIEEESERYARELDMLARYLITEFHGRCLALLSGPSSSGKTTTALMLRDHLRALGVDAYTISMDDFYRGREQAPRNPDGTYDYESLQALRLDALEQCMQEIVKDGKTMLPKFDFQAGCPSPECTELTVRENSVVIFEGIHAINPYFERHVPSEALFKIFVNTVTPFYEGDCKLVARRDIRLTRRLLRDERFRNSPVANTLSMWKQVVYGENEYMFPYVDTVDYLIDTTHAYEPCVFAPLLLPSLKEVKDDNPHADIARRLTEVLGGFEPISVDMIPHDAMLREFVGGGIY